MTTQIWSVELMQKNGRNQTCRQEFLVLASSAEEAQVKARTKADSGRTIVEVTVQEIGDSYCIHH